MFAITNDSVTFRRTGFALLLMQLALFMYGLPPFHFGVWVQVEPVLLMMFLYAYLTSAWLAFGIAKRWLIPEANAPLWCAVVAWAVWQIVPTLLATTPWRSWFGPPELGEGMAWHVSLLLMVMLAYPLMQVSSYRRIIVIAAFAFIALQATLHVVSPRNEITDELGFNADRWVATRYPKDLPFMAAYLWIFIACWRQIKSKIWYIAYLAFFVTVLAISNNRTAIALLGGALALSVVLKLIRRPSLRRFFYPSRKWRIAAISGCLMPFIWVLFCVNIGALGSYIDKFDNLERSLNLPYNFWLNTKDGTIGGRIPFIQVAWETLEHEPNRWLAGDGWGRFTDDSYKYALVDGIYAYKNGVHTPNWTMLQDVPVIHCHDQPIEALLSLGLPGMLLWLAVPMLGIWYLPKRFFWSVAPMLVGLNALSFFWFELVQEMPFRALMLASLCQVSIVRIRPFFKKTDWLVLLLTSLCLIMGWSTWEQRSAILYSQQIRESLMSGSFAYKEEWLAEDFKRGGDRLRETALLYEIMLAGSIHAQPADDIDYDWYRLFLKTSHDYSIMPNSATRAATTELLMMKKLFGELSVPSFAALKMEIFPAIPEAVLINAKKAPLRDDVAATFLANLPKITNNDTERQIDFLNKLLAIAPDHRGALWVLGHILAQTPGREAEGEAMIRRAVELHVERVYPVTDEELAGVR